MFDVLRPGTNIRKRNSSVMGTFPEFDLMDRSWRNFKEFGSRGPEATEEDVDPMRHPKSASLVNRLFQTLRDWEQWYQLALRSSDSSR